MFGRRLKELREINNYSMDKLIQLYNMRYDAKMNKSTLSRYENGLQVPIYTVVVNLADFFNVSVDYITGNSDTCDDFEKYDQTHTNKKKIPILGEIACGNPIYANEEFENYIEVGSDINADFCLIAKGDSMINARIFDGDTVFIKEQPQVENGEIAAVIIGDEATLKRFYRYKNHVELRAENPLYAPIEFNNEELENIKILGRAIAFYSELK